MRYVPGYTSYSPTNGEHAFDVKTEEQAIKDICMEIDKLINYCKFIADSSQKISDLFVDDFNNISEQLNETLAILNKSYEDMISDVTIGEKVYDITQGSYTDSKTANINMSKWIKNEEG